MVSLEAGIADGNVVREKLKQQVADERQKTKDLQRAWEIKSNQYEIEK